MVIRKPVSRGFSPPIEQQNSSFLPYPVTPISPTRAPGSPVSTSSQLENSDHYLQTPPSKPLNRLPSSIIAGSDMNEEPQRNNKQQMAVPNELHSMLRAGEGRHRAEPIPTLVEFPSILRAGPSAETPRTSSESLSPCENGSASTQVFVPNKEGLRQSSPHSIRATNPYYRVKSSEPASNNIVRSNEESSVGIWAGVMPSPPAPATAPAQGIDTPVLTALTQQTANLSLPGISTTSGLGPWNNTSLSADGHDDLISLEDKVQPPLELPTQSLSQHDSHNLITQNQWWNEAHRRSSEAQPAPTGLPNIDTHPSGPDNVSLSTEINADSPILDTKSSEALAPEVPPRMSHGQKDSPPEPLPPSKTATHSDNHGLGSLRIEAETPQTRARRERSETYQIKQITWFDYSSPSNPRRSPIMVQNANGPCPLLALVNALTLSTPSNLDTALIETLRVREQITLGLLLDAVFDELMSGRRGDAAQELPDVADLYAFLITLHTGMNVNPCFVPGDSQTPNIIDASGTSLPATVREFRRPGGFEETKEMKLYSTFAIPLIHGWLPPRSHPAYAALERSARTYEDAQNLMFHEEELEDKLQQQGLNQEEQLMLEDIATIKYFLSYSATQLTSYGLDILADALAPGSIAILFRNDHFSTLYKHPRSGQLLTLVTDMGYAGHDEVVWESLVDVSGEACEFYAGDFRPVGNTASEAQQQKSGRVERDEQGWTTVSRSTRNAPAQASGSLHPASNNVTSTSSNSHQVPTIPLEQTFDLPVSPTAEQEDHDLALAMQLQEEEEDRSRRESAARRREDELSQAYLSSRETLDRPVNNSRRQEVRSLVPPRGGSAARGDPEAGDDAPPPSYEQAAKSLPYHPPVGQPVRANAVPFSSGVSGARPQGVRPRQSSAYAEHAAFSGSSPSTHRGGSVARGTVPIRGGRVGGLDGAPGVMRRRSAGISPGRADTDDDGKKDCIVM